jgi:cytochrome P450
MNILLLPLMKTLTFNIICSLLFGVERGARRDKFVACFQEMIVGIWSVPINLPFTRYKRGLRASATVQNMVKDLIREKRVEVEQKGASPHQDLIACLLGMRKEDNEEAVTENEIVHNVMLVMVAGHDTSSVLMTFMIKFLANEPTVYAAVLQGMHNTLFLSLSQQ